MRASDFDFDLPEALIAQEPLAERDASRLLVINRSTGTFQHRRFKDLGDYFEADDLVVLNNSRVLRARLRGVNQRSGGAFELLLVEETAPNLWWAMIKPGKRARVGTRISLSHPAGSPTPVHLEVKATNAEGHRQVHFEGTENILTELDQLGEVPLPPYIHRRAEATDADHYQTVFGGAPGSVAAPTAGLHFARDTLTGLQSRGIRICEVTLHVGLGTFAPVKVESLEDHVMHEERYAISEASAKLIQTTRRTGRRILAVGTTVLRTLESATDADSAEVRSGPGRTRLFIHPPYRFRSADALLTNFHLPRSTLLMLVCAFASPGATGGRDLILRAYAEAVRERYRFFSYGDAMLIL
ncbi:MAG: tRNA preQ1(34) S-adenosylmethionine ribosyltransferase-isomerase QueA [Verrucomicrobia bacterium]|jgi:S-adenosylmethionine:tRNA ribosyltransferase-isomerase|nr:tRNA preQ1(34) S-adenosylmethionine ribosyltransferase-isomerase QueA [Verrucomicrobiota bacterium]